MRAGPRRRPLRERTCQLARTGLANTILARVAHEEGAAQAAARQRAARRARNREERYTGVTDTEGISRGLVAEPEPDPFADLPELEPGSPSSSDPGGEGEGEPIWVREPAGVPRRLWPRLRADRPASTGGRPGLTEAEFAECVPGLSGVPAPAPLPVGHAFGFVDTSLDVAGAFLRHEPREPRRLVNYRRVLLRPGLAAQREFASVSDRWLAERAVPRRFLQRRVCWHKFLQLSRDCQVEAHCRPPRSREMPCKSLIFCGRHKDAHDPALILTYS
jgi:hypothetical protein